MAERPIFVPSTDGPRFVEEVAIEFDWNPGFAPVQKRKNIAALHAAAARRGYSPLLEVSTKSDEKLGERLSSFNLMTDLLDGTRTTLECAYQGSKVFEGGGPYTDLYKVSSKEAKRDPRLRGSGAIIGFSFEGFEFPPEPKTAFYDWLYVRTLAPHEEFLKRLHEYAGFTDIEFNPAYSLNCQARSCALFVALSRTSNLGAALRSADAFVRTIAPQPLSYADRQRTLL
jgi:hypothetical protein